MRHTKQSPQAIATPMVQRTMRLAPCWVRPISLPVCSKRRTVGVRPVRSMSSSAKADVDSVKPGLKGGGGGNG